MRVIEVRRGQNYTTRYTCRVCGSQDLTPLFSLGEQYVNDFVDPGKERQGQPVPIELELCGHCALVQLKHTAPQEILYARHYWYRSGVTDTMSNALGDITKDAEDLISLRPGDVVLDIGSNDGTLLRSYTAQGVVRVGVEPANNLAKEGAEGVEHFIHDFWGYPSYFDKVKKKARVITAIGMFYDLEDPNQFIQDVALALDDDGVFIAQLMCLKNMLNLGDVGNLVHEHLEFYSFNSLQYLFGKHGMEIVDVITNRVNGESYRLYVKKISKNIDPRGGSLKRLMNVIESEEGLDTRKPYDEFFARVEHNKRLTQEFIKQEINLGRKVWVYGASTKGNVVLQYYGLDSRLIDGAAERSPEKWGKVTIGTGIPIYSEEDARAANPDYFLVLPYAFLDEFVVREEDWRHKGGRFIVPLPEFKVV